MSRWFSLIVLLALLTGCSHSNSNSGKKGTTSVDRWATTPLPVPPKVPSTSPIQEDVTTANSGISVARTDIQQVVTDAARIPAAESDVKILNHADSNLVTSQQKLSDALVLINELQAKLNESEKVHNQNELTMQKDIADLKKAANIDAASANKQIASLQSENEQLRNEAMNKVRERLEWLGALLCLGGIASFALSFYIGFTAGHFLGPIMGSCGMLMLGFARMLPKIEEYGEIGCLVVAVFLVLWLVWHAFKHTPTPVPNTK